MAEDDRTGTDATEQSGGHVVGDSSVRGATRSSHNIATGSTRSEVPSEVIDEALGRDRDGTVGTASGGDDGAEDSRILGGIGDTNIGGTEGGIGAPGGRAREGRASGNDY